MTSSGAGSGIDADPEAIRTEGERLQGLAGDFAIAADYATEADPDWHMWGVQGIPLAGTYYGVAEAIQEILKMFEPATTGLGQRFIDSAAAYTTSDETTVEEFGSQEGEITGV